MQDFVFSSVTSSPPMGGGIVWGGGTAELLDGEVRCQPSQKISDSAGRNREFVTKEKKTKEEKKNALRLGLLLCVSVQQPTGLGLYLSLFRAELEV